MSTTLVESPTRFQDLGLSSATLDVLEKIGYTEPTPIQIEFIPKAIQGKDVVGQARTGTGKTAAFLIPLIEGFEEAPDLIDPESLILAPTRELAQQVYRELEKLSAGRHIRYVLLVGGKPMKSQISRLRQGVDVVIGTPGRVIDHLKRGNLNCRDINLIVLDEADRMLDIGFRPDIEKILRRCPTDRQTLLLSATIDEDIQKLAQRYMRNPVQVNVSSGDIAATTVEQYYLTVEPRNKLDSLIELFKLEQPDQAIVFCRTKRGTDLLVSKLKGQIKQAAAMHGDMPQRVRDQVMSRFREGKIRCLVATDVVGRGIDVSNISHIVNYDVPQTSDDYVHRVGRTGRMGRSGVAYTFVTQGEGEMLTEIEMLINQQLKPYKALSSAPPPEPITQPEEQEEKSETPKTKKYRRAL